MLEFVNRSYYISYEGCRKVSWGNASVRPIIANWPLSFVNDWVRQMALMSFICFAKKVHFLPPKHASRWFSNEFSQLYWQESIDGDSFVSQARFDAYAGPAMVVPIVDSEYEITSNKFSVNSAWSISKMALLWNTVFEKSNFKIELSSHLRTFILKTFFWPNKYYCTYWIRESI